MRRFDDLTANTEEFWLQTTNRHGQNDIKAKFLMFYFCLINDIFVLMPLPLETSTESSENSRILSKCMHGSAMLKIHDTKFCLKLLQLLAFLSVFCRLAPGTSQAPHRLHSNALPASAIACRQDRACGTHEVCPWQVCSDVVGK